MEKAIFQTIDVSTARTNAFGVSVTLHIALLATLLAVPLLFTRTLTLHRAVTLIAPPPLVEETIVLKAPPLPPPTPPAAPPTASASMPAPAPLPTPVSAPSNESNPVFEPAPVTPEPIALRAVAEPEPIAPIPIGRTAQLPNPATMPVAPPKLAVLTNVFSGDGAAQGSGGSSGRRDIQTAGFGGGAGASGASRAVAQRNIRDSGFGEIKQAATAPELRKPAAEPPEIPAEITFKPRPDYTEEARQLRLEGEVVLRVNFTASGEVRVIELLKGLGRGLDENARHAAERIRFKPAMRDRKPIDSTAIVHIAFQLAY